MWTLSGALTEQLGEVVRARARKRGEVCEPHILIEVRPNVVEDQTQAIPGQASTIVPRFVRRHAVATRQVDGDR